MPNRIIRESCRTSLTLNDLSDGAERLHWRLVTVADDYGRFNADPAVVKSLCFPLRADARMCKQVSAWLDEMCNVGLIVRYWGDDSSGQRKICAFYPNWEESNGKPRAQKSKFPLPTSANKCSHLQTNVPVTESGSRYANIEHVKRTAAPPGVPAPSPSDFQRFRSIYPRREAWQRAQIAWEKQHEAGNLPCFDQIEAAIRWQTETGCLRQELAKNPDGRDARPLPATWINGHRWTDEPPAKPKAWKPPEERAQEGDTSGLADFFVKGPPPSNRKVLS